MTEADEKDDPYSVPCPGCPGRIAMGSAVRGGRVICTDCGEIIPLVSLLIVDDSRLDVIDQPRSP